MFKIPHRFSEIQELRARIARQEKEIARLASLVARMPEPPRSTWERHSAPELVPEPEMPPISRQPSALLQLLFSNPSQA
jgi:hypothetical protein